MPVYEYRCLGCTKPFTVTQTLSEHGSHKPQCPSCGSPKVEQEFSGFFAKTRKKS